MYIPKLQIRKVEQIDKNSKMKKNFSLCSNNEKLNRDVANKRLKKKITNREKGLNNQCVLRSTKSTNVFTVRCKTF